MSMYDPDKSLEDYMRLFEAKILELHSLMPKLEAALLQHDETSADLAKLATFKVALMMASQNRPLNTDK